MVARITHIGYDFNEGLNVITVNNEFRFLFLFQWSLCWDLFSCLLRRHICISVRIFLYMNF